MDIKERFGVNALPTTTIEKCALLKAVLYIVHADNVVTDEEKKFLIDLVGQMGMDQEMISMAVNMSQQEVIDNLNPILLSVLDKAAEADGFYSPEEKKITTDIFTQMKESIRKSVGLNF
ncbi:MAG: hypothetical protein HUJ68_09470 [Clostridia bacterium]|nr:hypothetical protein [Clostridia bacterium]